MSFRDGEAVADKLKTDNDDQRFGIEIVRKAVQMLLRQIVENAGEDGAVIAGKTLATTSATAVSTRRASSNDLVKVGIIDPTKVARSVLQDTGLGGQSM